MKKIISTVVMLLSLFLATTANAKYVETEAEIVNRLNSLSWDQRKLLIDTYFHAKNYGYADTLSGILMTESNFGEVMVNPHDGKGTKYPGSYSAYQIHLNSFMECNGLKGKDTANRISNKLVKDQAYARNIAIKMLQEWEDLYSRKNAPNAYKEMLASYNAGNKGLDSPKGREYANIVSFRGKVIGKWIQSNKSSKLVAYKKTIIKTKKA